MKSTWGGILIAIGLIIMTLTGLCSAYFLIGFLGSGERGMEGLALIPLVVGGVPFLAGLALFFWGRSLIRAARREQQD